MCSLLKKNVQHVLQNKSNIWQHKVSWHLCQICNHSKILIQLIKLKFCVPLSLHEYALKEGFLSIARDCPGLFKDISKALLKPDEVETKKRTMQYLTGYVLVASFHSARQSFLSPISNEFQFLLFKNRDVRLDYS